MAFTEEHRFPLHVGLDHHGSIEAFQGIFPADAFHPLQGVRDHSNVAPQALAPEFHVLVVLVVFGGLLWVGSLVGPRGIVVWLLPFRHRLEATLERLIQHSAAIGNGILGEHGHEQSCAQLAEAQPMGRLSVSSAPNVRLIQLC